MATKQAVIGVGGMSCQGCVKNVTGVLQALPGVEQVEVSLEKAQATIVFDEARVGEAQFREAIEDAGFDIIRFEVSMSNETNACTTAEPIRLTSLSHGGGCGCKIAPGVLEQILAKTAKSVVPPQLLVGIETADDAAVYQINETQAIVATTDFFMPIVDDPFDFGRIAATNAISDVYAMGGTPLFALGLVGMPVNKLPMETIRRILEGGESVCAAAGIPIAGGHTIDSVEPIYGLVAIGLVDPANLKRNAGAKPGDKLILGKGLGVGIYSAAFKKEQLAAPDYATMIASTTQLNTPGSKLGSLTYGGSLGENHATISGSIYHAPTPPAAPSFPQEACDPLHINDEVTRLSSYSRQLGITASLLADQGGDYTFTDSHVTGTGAINGRPVNITYNATQAPLFGNNQNHGLYV